MEFPSYIEILNESSSLLDRYNARGENVMEPEVGFDQFRVGSQFFVITRKHSLMVIKDRLKFLVLANDEDEKSI
ncbi:hypothetical protein K7X08_031887 [Anisodus acutangulus]|uniref:Uncharacterized protein n=1 Tax=Anisodus acutangulus TaxID=402998 RepID=A0A9Q1RMJ1_9SOLA|nr:hypothetical protein K7X08_031887 [Anisodus acutangulus]